MEKIIYIVDDVYVRKSVGTLFKSEGIIYVSFKSTEEFLKNGVINGKRIIILDLQMPGMKSWDL